MAEALTITAIAPSNLEITELSADGRRARGQRTRRRVAESLVALLEAGDDEPTARRIAETAGVSLRLVFHHFDDMEDLYRAVWELQYERYWRDLPSVSPSLPPARRADRTARIRSSIFERVAPVRRAGLRKANQSESLAILFAEANASLRFELVKTFAPELTERSPSDADELLSALDAAASWESWERLRRNQSLPVMAARRTMSRTLLALVSLPPAAEPTPG